jgi:chemotaxis response regulator CheB
MDSFAAPTARTQTRSYEIGAVAIVASAGGIPAEIELLRGLNTPSCLPVIIAQHLARFSPSVLPSVLRSNTGRSVKWAEQDESPAAGMVYVVPPAMLGRGLRLPLRAETIAG